MINLIQFGLGGVGRALVHQVSAMRGRQSRVGVELNYVALADSSGALIEERGLDQNIVESAVRLKARGGSLHEHEAGYFQSDPAAVVDMAGDGAAIVVDTTAAGVEELLPAYELALSRGYPLVLANKKPLTSSLNLWDLLTRDGRTGYEATVGAGLPVISTLRYLLETGDDIQRIEGVFSGTLGFLMSELQRGTSFGDAVRDARARGWTEPDPRDDLSGMDVARKLLILARTLGREVEMRDVEVTPLYSPEYARLALDDFMARLDELNPVLASQLNTARASNHFLRYAATLDEERLTCSAHAVTSDSPLAALRGPDNLIAFHTARYTPRPLVIQGAGAGTDVTASAVLGDILRLARKLI
jgi:homoserine dehydrogenase